MSALKTSPTLRKERREKDGKEMAASEQRVCRQLVGNCCGLTELTCAVLDVRATRWKHQINPAIPPWIPWNNDSAADAQSASSEKTSCGLCVDVWRLRLGWRR